MFDCRRKHEARERHRRTRTRPTSGDAARTEEAMAYLEGRLGLTAEQRRAWRELAEAIRDSADAMQTAHDAIDDVEGSALARITNFEVVAEVTTAALRRIRPALERLYVSLDETQRRTLDGWISHWPAYRPGANH